MRKPIMAGNWKMYKTPAETTQFFEKFRPLVEKSEHAEIVICPPFTNLAAAAAAAQGSHIQVGAQNIAWAKEGAFTGEISGSMIRSTGATHAIRSESRRGRRRRPGEPHSGWRAEHRLGQRRRIHRRDFGLDDPLDRRHPRHPIGISPRPPPPPRGATFRLARRTSPGPKKAHSPARFRAR